jgi:hypothetical protein
MLDELMVFKNYYYGRAYNSWRTEIRNEKICSLIELSVSGTQ